VLKNGSSTIVFDSGALSMSGYASSVLRMRADLFAVDELSVESEWLRPILRNIDRKIVVVAASAEDEAVLQIDEYLGFSELRNPVYLGIGSTRP